MKVYILGDERDFLFQAIPRSITWTVQLGIATRPLRMTSLSGMSGMSGLVFYSRALSATVAFCLRFVSCC
jgi:hypothetical protein